MIPIDQIRIGDPQGQCTEACVASLLEVPLEAIPDLYGGQAKGDTRPMRRWVKMLACITVHGFQWVVFDLGEKVPIDDFDLDALGLGSRARECARGHHLIGGDNPDGDPHMCVGLDGAVVHDPNPSRRGLINVEEVVIFLPDDDIDEEWAHWSMRQYRRVDGEWVLTMEDEG